MNSKKTEKEEEIIQSIRNEEVKRKSKAVRVNNLFLKYKKWFRQTYETVPFKQPVMFFERRSGEVEFYEDVTVGLFDYTHSDGQKRFIMINPSKQKKFGFADKQFKGYYCHEDYPLPLPQDPFLTVEQVNIMIEKALNDVKEWKTKEIRAKSDFLWKAGLVIAIIVVAFALYRLLVPTPIVAPTRIISQSAMQSVNITPTVIG